MNGWNSPGMHVLDKNSGFVNNEDEDDCGEAGNNKILVLLLEQEILFIELTLPQYVDANNGFNCLIMLYV